MITSNSTRPTRVDTRRSTLALDYQRPPLLLLRAARALRRAVLLAWHRWQLACLVAEREGYQKADEERRRKGMTSVIGRMYLAECARQERVLRGRIAFLECDL